MSLNANLWGTKDGWAGQSKIGRSSSPSSGALPSTLKRKSGESEMSNTGQRAYSYRQPSTSEPYDPNWIVEQKLDWIAAQLTALQPKPRPRKEHVEDSRFLRLWEVYPRKVGRAPALRAFANLNPTKEVLESIISDVEFRVGLGWWKADPMNMQYIPHLSTYLNQRRWEDDRAERVERKMETDL